MFKHLICVVTCVTLVSWSHSELLPRKLAGESPSGGQAFARSLSKNIQPVGVGGVGGSKNCEESEKLMTVQTLLNDLASRGAINALTTDVTSVKSCSTQVVAGLKTSFSIQVKNPIANAKDKTLICPFVVISLSGALTVAEANVLKDKCGFLLTAPFAEKVSKAPLENGKSSVKLEAQAVSKPTLVVGNHNDCPDDKKESMVQTLFDKMRANDIIKSIAVLKESIESCSTQITVGASYNVVYKFDSQTSCPVQALVIRDKVTLLNADVFEVKCAKYLSNKYHSKGGVSLDQNGDMGAIKIVGGDQNCDESTRAKTLNDILDQLEKAKIFKKLDVKAEKIASCKSQLWGPGDTYYKFKYTANGKDCVLKVVIPRGNKGKTQWDKDNDFNSCANLFHDNFIIPVGVNLQEGEGQTFTTEFTMEEPEPLKWQSEKIVVVNKYQEPMETGGPVNCNDGGQDTMEKALNDIMNDRTIKKIDLASFKFVSCQFRSTWPPQYTIAFNYKNHACSLTFNKEKSHYTLPGAEFYADDCPDIFPAPKGIANAKACDPDIQVQATKLNQLIDSLENQNVFKKTNIKADDILICYYQIVAGINHIYKFKLGEKFCSIGFNELSKKVSLYDVDKTFVKCPQIFVDKFDKEQYKKDLEEGVETFTIDGGLELNEPVVNIQNYEEEVIKMGPMKTGGKVDCPSAKASMFKAFEDQAAAGIFIQVDKDKLDLMECKYTSTNPPEYKISFVYNKQPCTITFEKEDQTFSIFNTESAKKDCPSVFAEQKQKMGMMLGAPDACKLDKPLDKLNEFIDVLEKAKVFKTTNVAQTDYISCTQQLVAGMNYSFKFKLGQKECEIVFNTLSGKVKLARPDESFQKCKEIFVNGFNPSTYNRRALVLSVVDPEHIV